MKSCVRFPVKAMGLVVLSAFVAALGLSSCSQAISSDDLRAASANSAAARSTIDPATYSGVVIYYKASSAPTIWVWEDSGNAISANMGFTWATQPSMTADDAHSGWYYYAIPSTYLSGKNLKMKFNKGAEISRGAATTGWYNPSTGAWTTSCPDLSDITIYYKGSSAPTIWIWELNANAISSLMGYTWATQPTMTACADHAGWYYFTVPGSKRTGANLLMKFNQGSEIARGSAATGWYDSANAAWFDSYDAWYAVYGGGGDDDPTEDVTIYYKGDAAPKIWVWELNANAISANMGYTWTTQPTMTAVENYANWYSFTIPASYLSGANLVMKFNSGSDVARGSGKTGWYYSSTSTWYDTCQDTPVVPTIAVSPASGTYRGAATVSIKVSSSMVALDSATATFGTATVALTGGSATITLSDYVADGASSILSVSGTNSVGTNTQVFYFTRNDAIAVDPFSWDNALVYFVMTDRFYNGDSSNDASYGRTNNYGGSLSSTINTATFHGGDIAGLTAKLNAGYFRDLGVNAIWITAPYEQMHGFVGGGYSNGAAAYPHYGYHGYYTLDWTEMDKNMGTVAEFRTFVKTAHSQGIRVVMDIVMNHTGYENIADAVQYGYGATGLTLSGARGWKPSGGTYGDWDEVNDVFTGSWSTWWSANWVRSSHYGNTGSSDLTLSVGCLPDIKTETTSNVALAPILQTKWASETSGYGDWIVPAASSLRADLGIAPADYQVKWLAAWVEEFGIDGFRCDTAKHVDLYRWAQLKSACNTALAAWRASSRSADDEARDWDDDFWMTAEVWGHGVGRSTYFDNGFDSVINFTFPKSKDVSSIGSTWASYATALNNGDDGYNVLSYLNSHDARENYGWVTTDIAAGTCLILSPGGVQIYYGDEVVRPLAGDLTNDLNQATRSDYQWSAQNTTVLAHWQKLGKFRFNHKSVGGGSQTTIATNVYGRSLTEDGVTDKVVIAINQSGSVAVPVSGFFSAGDVVRNAYDGSTATVSSALTATFTAANGVILIEADE